MNASELISRLENETGQRVDDPNSMAYAGLLGAVARAMGVSKFDARDDVAVGVVLGYQMSPEHQAEEDALNTFANLLKAGMSPDDARSLLG